MDELRLHAGKLWSMKNFTLADVLADNRHRMEKLQRRALPFVWNGDLAMMIFTNAALSTLQSSHVLRRINLNFGACSSMRKMICDDLEVAT